MIPTDAKVLISFIKISLNTRGFSIGSNLSFWLSTLYKIIPKSFLLIGSVYSFYIRSFIYPKDTALFIDNTAQEEE